jgi:hypothetical protein
MIVEEIKGINIMDGSRHFNMISEKKGKVHFAILDKEMCACDWNVPKEGKVFLKELEKYADEHRLLLTISNVINPALEHILRKADYIDYYIRDEYMDDTMQCWKRKN